MFFLWDDQNTEHIAKHDVDRTEAEWVVRHAARPYPQKTSKVKWVVKGRTPAGRRIQVIYVERDADEVILSLLTPSERLELMEGEKAKYVIHARDLRPGER
jgi:uncharacterized DUF497 family protein